MNGYTPASHAPVAQLDRVLPSEGRGRTFESCRARHIIKDLGRHLVAFFLTYGKYTEISVLSSVKTDAKKSRPASHSPECIAISK